VHQIVRTGVIACLIAGILNLPIIAAAARPLGMVIVAENAHLSGANANVGADVFTGDALQTDPGGSLRLKFGSTQLYLTSDSNALLGQEANPLRVKLTRGRLGFSSGVAGQFEVETPIGTVRSADGQRAFGEVTILGPQKILVAAYHGSLVVAGAGVERTIPEGNAYNVTLTPDSDPAAAGPAPAAPKPALHPAVGSLAFDLVLLGVAGGLGYAAWHFATESDTVPTTH
jgi:hypothetical protein